MNRSDRTRAIMNIKSVGLVEFVTIAGLADIIGKSRSSVMRYEKDETFPSAPLIIRGRRYYPRSLAERLVPLVRKIPPHKKPEAELVSEIYKTFKEETTKLCQK